MNVRRSLIVGLLAGTVSLGAVPLAHAAFLDTAQASSAFSTGTLAPASGLVLDRRCDISLLGIVLGAELDASWNASGSAWVGGYRVDLLDSNGLLLQTQNTTAGVRNATFALTELLTATYRVRVTSTYASWTSDPVSASNSSC